MPRVVQLIRTGARVGPSRMEVGLGFRLPTALPWAICSARPRKQVGHRILSVAVPTLCDLRPNVLTCKNGEGSWLCHLTRMRKAPLTSELRGSQVRAWQSPHGAGDGKYVQGWTDVNSNLSSSTGPPAGATRARDFPSEPLSSPEKWAVTGMESVMYHICQCVRCSRV